jgi:hypothetical protein
LFHSSQDNWYNGKWVAEEVVNNLGALLRPIDFLENTFVDGGTGTSKSRWHLECFSFVRRKVQHLLSDRLKKLNALGIGFDVKVVVVSLFLDAVKTLFKSILAVGDESRVFGGPGWVRSPFIVEHGVAHLIPATAWLEFFLKRVMSAVSLPVACID